jgi:hypothetical protein
LGRIERCTESEAIPGSKCFTLLFVDFHQRTRACLNAATVWASHSPGVSPTNKLLTGRWCRTTCIRGRHMAPQLAKDQYGSN